MIIEALGVAGAQVRYVGIDRDASAIELARPVLAEAVAGTNHRFDLIHGNFGEIQSLLGSKDIRADALFLDLGVSSMQLDQRHRGFSLLEEGPLDMRMDPHDKVTAASLVNEGSVNFLGSILRTYGGEKNWRKLTALISGARQQKRIETTTELVKVLAPGLDWKRMKQGKSHPATKTFQALRIAVNNELHFLDKGLGAAPNFVKPGGLLAVLTFHSLEERVVEKALRNSNSWTHVATPQGPDQAEIETNPRSRSAKLISAIRSCTEK
mmetsp:Transcript_8746/g.15359  ORF Transcript_8746/g.15359 Transcript_8746/m.15359 type:complete len:267 (-) Transcript_8746:39-839(-)